MRNYKEPDTTARTNFFRVKNPKFFEFIMDNLDVKYSFIVDDSGESHYAILSDDDSGRLPEYIEFKDGQIDVAIKHPDFEGNIILDAGIVREIHRNKEHINQIHAIINHLLPSVDIKSVKFTLPNASNNHTCDLFFNLADVISNHLPNGVTAVLMGVETFKNLNALTGYATATTNSKSVTISLDNIYDIAAKKLNVSRESIATCKGMEISTLEEPTGMSL